MKSLMTVIAFALVATSAFAESELTCWNIFSKKGERPILRAQILKNEGLGNVTLDLKSPLFESYFVNKTESAGERWGNKPQTRISFIANPQHDLEAVEITTNRSPYKGNNEYAFILGKYSFVAPYIQQAFDYGARIILPKDLSNANLSKFRIRDANERSNAVMVYSPSMLVSQSGSSYLRMFCVSR